MEIPLLLPSGRTREFDSYSSTQVAKIIYSWLFTELGHIELDKFSIEMMALEDVVILRDLCENHLKTMVKKVSIHT